MKLCCYITYILCFVIKYSLLAAGEDENSLEFLIIGDWGKGGNSGNILNNLYSAESDQSRLLQGRKQMLRAPYPQVTYERDDAYSVNGYNKDNKEEKRKHYTYQAAIAQSMSEWANTSEITPSFVIAVGDNFYDDGVSSVSDTAWNTLWKDVYLANYTNLRIPWYPVLGNHDYGYGLKGALAEVNRFSVNSSDISAGLWRSRGFNYSETFYIDGGGTVVIVFVDTTTLAPSENKCCNENGGVTVEEQAERIANQISHIRRMLQEAQALSPTWLLMVGHYPVFSSGEHGDTDELLTYLLPLIREYSVSAYIAGHDHISEHLSANGTEYFISGAGAMTDVLGNTPSAADLQWSGTGYSAFSVVRASLTSLNVSFVHWNGSVMYSYVLNKGSGDSGGGGGDDGGGDNTITTPPTTGNTNDGNRRRSGGVLNMITVDDLASYIIPACGVISVLVALVIVLFVFTAHKRRRRRNTTTTSFSEDGNTITTSSDDTSDSNHKRMEGQQRPKHAHSRRKTRRHGKHGSAGRGPYEHIQNDFDSDDYVDKGEDDLLSRQERGVSHSDRSNTGDNIISRVLHTLPAADHGSNGTGSRNGSLRMGSGNMLSWGRVGDATGVLYTKSDGGRNAAHRKVRSSV